ncbi:RNA polymerase I-specific transcription initiation factor rrn7 [Lecanosticta acicola]|uniref:RNA polymerase I-specific transcription initiation factor rrn7 n=1 Tax=Lecanosticta acicola TaxID=111012 RepID=A0AAI8Z7Q1_9PEZI|nr:RNA polymerase I-specific transcription initiation factor rrn7 [Lecanosticta acicola]
MSQRLQRRNVKKPECSNENCGSRRFHVGDDGFTYCDQGHQQSELGTVVAEDTGELVTLGRTSRRKDSDAESQTSRVSGFRGPKAFEHYLLCAQLVLRKQLRWLIDVQGLPEELESLVKDLWALRLQKLQGQVTEDSETETEAASFRMFSSQSEGGSGTDGETAASVRRRQASRKKPHGPGLTDLICLIYVGIILLRIPLTIADLHKWINSGDLLFYSAAKELPLTMRDRLPGHLQEMLQPQNLVAGEVLHRNALELLRSLSTDFGMSAPPLNQPLILYRWVKELSLPLEIYVATQRLGRLLDADFSYTLDAKTRANMSLRCPEIRLMALVVIATKLLFPFDDLKRYPTSSRDLAALHMDWPLWVKLQNHGSQGTPSQDGNPHVTFEDAFKMTEAESLDLADDRLDGYLDWYERNIASDEVRERGRAGREADFRRALFRMFPAQNANNNTRARPEIETGGKTSADKLFEVQSSLRTKRIVREEAADEIPRPGSEHSLYRAEEDLEGPIKLFYAKCAEMAGFSLHGMVRAVFLMERRLMKLRKDLS